MPNYTFEKLSPVDFEDLVRDLLQKKLDRFIESFKIGRDGGIDLRASLSKDKNTIIQCKHYAKTGYSGLLSHLKNRELEKVKRLNPDRYILATSVGLSPKNKGEIKKLFSPFITADEDVLGADDLNNLLGQNTDVEKKHFKLWIESTGVLESIFHSDVFNETLIDQEAIARKIDLYVHSEAYERALELLQTTNFCIVSGEPGIGKTTLAEMIIINHLAAGFEAIKVRSDIKEAVKLLNIKKKQLFYYDDFLGQTKLGEKLQKNEDSSLLKLIEHIKSSTNHRLILTTREYILAQAKQEYEKIGHASLDLNKCTIDLSDYNKVQKARILYNHLYFSSVPKEFINSLLEDRNYLKIINHPNYNPRIIEWMTIQLHSDSLTSTNYFTEFKRNLDYPKDLWNHAFNEEISFEGRVLVMCLATVPGDVVLKDLELIFKGHYESFANNLKRPLNSNAFLKGLKEIEGTFVKIKAGRVADRLVEFQNPSVKDYIGNYLLNNRAELDALIESVTFFPQLARINLLVNGEVFRGCIKYKRPILNSLLNHNLRTSSYKEAYFLNSKSKCVRYLLDEINYEDANIFEDIVRPAWDEYRKMVDET